MSATGSPKFWANAALSDFEELQITEKKKKEYAAENAALSELIYKKNKEKDLKDMQIIRFGDVAIAIHRPANVKNIPQGGLGSVYPAYPIRSDGLIDKSVKLAVKILKDTKRTVANDENAILDKNKNSDAAVMAETRNAQASFSARTTRIPAREKSPEGETIYETVILMSAAPGIDLLRFLTEKNFTQTLTPARRIELAINVIKAYMALHKKGVYHGDIKLENILVNPETLELTIIDLDTKVRTNRTVAPEDFVFALYNNGNYPKEATEKADIYSIAQGVLIPILTGNYFSNGVYRHDEEWYLDNHKMKDNDDEKMQLRKCLGLGPKDPFLKDTVEILDKMRKNDAKRRCSLQDALEHFTGLLAEKGVVADDQSQAHRQQLWSLDRVLSDPKYQIAPPEIAPPEIVPPEIAPPEKASTFLGFFSSFWSSKNPPANARGQTENARDQTHLPDRRPGPSGSQG